MQRIKLFRLPGYPMTCARALLCLFTVLRVLTLPVHAQSENAVRPAERDSVGFHPGSAAPFIVQLPDAIAVFKGSSLSLERGGKSRLIALPAELEQVTSARLFRRDSLVVLGMVNGDVSIAVLVDLIRGVVTDSFLCYSPEVSPNGGYIAFIKFYPAHGVSSAESHYMLYDVSAGRSLNRPRLGKLDRACVGAVLFPERIDNVAGDNVDIEGRALHSMAGDQFFWSPDSRQIVFADQIEKSLSVIVVVLGGPSLKVTSTAIEPMLMCPQELPVCHERLTEVEFPSDASGSYRLSFRGVMGTPEVHSFVSLAPTPGGGLAAARTTN